jgi:hypothetical protein
MVGVAMATAGGTVEEGVGVAVAVGVMVGVPVGLGVGVEVSKGFGDAVKVANKVRVGRGDDVSTTAAPSSSEVKTIEAGTQLPKIERHRTKNT